MNLWFLRERWQLVFNKSLIACLPCTGPWAHSLLEHFQFYSPYMVI